jgi:hypothetical protein
VTTSERQTAGRGTEEPVVTPGDRHVGRARQDRAAAEGVIAAALARAVNSASAGHSPIPFRASKPAGASGAPVCRTWSPRRGGDVQVRLRACPVDHGTGWRSQMLIEATSMVPL